MLLFYFIFYYFIILFIYSMLITLQGDWVFVNIQLGNNDWRKLGRDTHGNGFVSRFVLSFFPISFFISSFSTSPSSSSSTNAFDRGWRANKDAEWDEGLAKLAFTSLQQPTTLCRLLHAIHISQKGEARRRERERERG